MIRPLQPPSRRDDFYYVLRQIPLKKRAAYHALHTLITTFNQISEHYREPSVAAQKLHWWQDEIQRFFKDQATHPLLIALIPERARLSQTALLALIEANLLSLKTHIFETHSELMQHYQHLGGIQFDLKAKILELQTAPITLHTLGTVSEILRHLIHFRHFIQKQHLYFSLEDFRTHQIDPQPILQGREPDSLRPLFDAHFLQAKTALPAYDPAFKPLYLEVKLQAKQTQRIQEKAWQWAQFQVELPPLQKLLLTLWP